MNIKEIEEYFKTAKLPEIPFYLNPSTRVDDIQLFLTSHIQPLKVGTNQRMAEPLIERLQRFKDLIEGN